LRLAEVARNWLPLAASWLVMGLEMPVVSAIMARLADPEIHLAAYGGVVFPIALIVEAPVIMLLAASVALAKDAASSALISSGIGKQKPACTQMYSHSAPSYGGPPGNCRSRHTL